MSIYKILETLDRAHTGPVCTLKDWDTRVIPKQAAKKVQEHGLQNTFSAENPINTDDALADEFYKAGFEMAVETGLLCVDTERVIKVTAEELRFALDSAPDELVLGKGDDALVLRDRRPEDPIKPESGDFEVMFVRDARGASVPASGPAPKIMDVWGDNAGVPASIWSYASRAFRPAPPMKRTASSDDRGVVFTSPVLKSTFRMFPAYPPKLLIAAPFFVQCAKRAILHTNSTITAFRCKDDIKYVTVDSR